MRPFLAAIAVVLLSADIAPVGAQTPAAAPTPAVAPVPVSPVAAPSGTPSQRLAQLFRDSDEAALKRNPLQGLYRGDLRYADQYGDSLSEWALQLERFAAERDLAALAAIDRAKLSPREQVSYDAFKYARATDLEGLKPALTALTVTRPIDHFTGPHVFFPDLSSGDGAAPFKTLADYENGLKRIDGFVAQLDFAIGRFTQGVNAGVVQPKLVVRNVIAQLDGLLAQGVDKSPFVKPVAAFPAAVPASEHARLRRAYRDAVAGKIRPAYGRMRKFLREVYLPRARDTAGLGEMKGGAALYTYLVARETTTTMTTQAIHELGLAEVARIRAAMEAVKTRIGFTGTLAAFFEDVRTNPKYKPASKADLQGRFVAVGKRVDAAMPRLFERMPKTGLEIRPVPDFLERSQADAYYQQGTVDGSRPGVFYFNTYDLPTRTIEDVETLYLHEAVPGHHYQISLAQEDAKLPPFQRFGGPTAYFEGWALYVESLGRELGLYADPVQEYGNLDSEIFRAMRLVVDTGLHSKGWSRDKAIQYMMDNSAISRTDATAEVERYIAIPGQALAYKVGQITIRRLRTKAEAALGARFDVRRFHTAVLEDGALPLAVLEAKIDRWIASQTG